MAENGGWSIADLIAEQAIMGRYGVGNIDLYNRPAVKVGNGIGSVYSMSFGEDGKEVLVPRVRPGLPRPMTEKEAIAWYKKTGEYLGKFNSPEEATEYANRLHQLQATLPEGMGK